MTFIGIDGGGTTTRMFVQQDDQTAEYFEFPVSLKVKSGDFARSATTLHHILRDNLALNTEGLALGIGLAGMSHEDNQDALKNAIQAQQDVGGVHIEGDATLALKAALGTSEEGVLVIAGTGSVAYARTKDGEMIRVGGFGPETSDEGSGYWIGLRVLRHYLRMFISGDREDALFKAVTAGLPKQVSSPREIANLLEREPLFPASLAPMVFQCAEGSDAAMVIIREAADCLQTMIEEVSVKLGDPRRVHLSGSIAKHPVMVKEMRKHLDPKRFELLLLDDRATANKALEIARSL